MKTKKLIAAVCGAGGVIVLLGATYPMLSYALTPLRKLPEIKSPVTNDYIKSISGLPDYTKASTWFAKEYGVGETSKVSHYQISIPKLGIKAATAEIGGEDLAESLIHFPDTGLPGRIGNSVVFGHSILPTFYDPKNYLAIFSTLPTLKKGDEIVVDYDGVIFRYQVEELFEVRPQNLEILEQDKSDSFLTLVTCTPPGHPLRPKRLVVRSRLVNPHQALK